MLGLQSTVAGIALLPASAITGILWDTFGAVVPFLFGASLSVAAALVLLLFLNSKPKIWHIADMSGKRISGNND
jgi:predicted MFS family arabinose efflux permease